MTLAYLQSRRIDYSCVATSAGIAMRLSEQAKWMVRNVCQANPSIRTAYPELFAVIGGKTPDYRDWFLRGGTAGQAGDEAQDSIRSHAHELTEHAHTLTIKDVASKNDVASMTPIYDTVTVGGISGVPVAKLKCHYIKYGPYFYSYPYEILYSCPKYGAHYYTKILDFTFQFNTPSFERIIQCGAPVNIKFDKEYDYNDTSRFVLNINKYDEDFAHTVVTANDKIDIYCSVELQTQNSGSSSSITYVSGMKMPPGSSAVNGTTDPGGAGQTRETGGVETAPKHKFVRYFIRARP